MARIMEVVRYDPAWAAQFEAEKPLVARALGDTVLAIHHVGSTAVPGIRAKPTLDFLVIVRDLAVVDERTAAMEALGYLAKGENGIPGRRYFSKHRGEQHTHHVHVYAEGHADADRLLAFRDYLIAHPDEAEEYSRLKERLAQAFRLDPEGYTGSKDGFIQGILEKAGR